MRRLKLFVFFVLASVSCYTNTQWVLDLSDYAGTELYVTNAPGQAILSGFTADVKK